MNVMPPTGESPDAIPRGLIIAFFIVFIAIIAAGIFFYQSQEQQIKNQVTTDLSSISTLKADQIASWSEERLETVPGTADMDKNPQGQGDGIP